MTLLMVVLLFGIYPFLAHMRREGYRKNANWVHVSFLFCYAQCLPTFDTIVNTTPQRAVLTWIILPWAASLLLGEFIYRYPLRRQKG